MNETKIKITTKKKCTYHLHCYESILYTCNLDVVFKIFLGTVVFCFTTDSCSGDVGAVLTVHWRNDDNRSGSRSGRENGEIGTRGATNPI